jgi:lipopolysaccharide/colanic/teichoic acid biosynthesis glycosyltransferase
LYRLFETRRAASHASEGAALEVRQNIIIIQASRLAWFYTKMVEELARHRTRIVAVLDTRPEFHGRSLNGYAVVGTPSHITRILDEYTIHGIKIDRLVLATNPDELSQAVWKEIQAVCLDQNIKIESLHEFFLSPSSDPIEGVPSLFADADSDPTVLTGPYWKIKRLIDIVLSVLVLIIIFPLATIVAGCVLLDVGWPILFWQQRVGYLGRPLFLYKFRTMAAPYDRNGNLVEPELRTSRLGLFLRKIRVDEIPQLANILTGHMSLIGPRPLLPIDQPENIQSRLQVRPGLTGLAQINGGKLLTPEEKDLLDDWYIRHASLRLDLIILVRTVWVILRGDRRNDGAIDLASIAGRDPLQPHKS